MQRTLIEDIKKFIMSQKEPFSIWDIQRELSNAALDAADDLYDSGHITLPFTDGDYYLHYKVNPEVQK